MTQKFPTYTVRTAALALLAISCLNVWAADTVAPKNPYLADSHYPLPHGTSAQLGATALAGPSGQTRKLAASEIDYLHTGPGYFGGFFTGLYPTGRRVMWINGLSGIYKIDHDSFEILAHLPPAEGNPFSEPEAEASIARLNESNDGFFSFVHAFRKALSLRDLSGVYTMLDKDNRFYIGHKSGKVLAFGDAEPGNPESAIAPLGEFVFPAEASGNLIGINMTFDGWIVAVTEHGQVLLVSRDLKSHHLIQMKHSEGAAEDSGRPGWGWVRNSFAVDKNGGIYIASREHMHKVVWTGEKLSTDEADGAWTAPYANSTGDGTGATPSLMGFDDDEDRLVVFTDGDALMNVVVMWRDEIPDDWQGLPDAPSRRIAGFAPASMGKLNLQAIQTEQSVAVEGYGALVVNNEANNRPWWVPDRASRILVSYLGSNPRHQPYGVQKFVWNPEQRKLELAWTNEGISSPNCVPMVSAASNRVYLIGARDNQWTLEAMNWETGEEDFHWVIGDQKYNPLFSGTLIDEAGRVFYSSTWGFVRLNPQAAQ